MRKQAQTIGFDFTGVELFLAYWAGQATLQRVLDHPAYQTVMEHARQFGGGITEADVITALNGSNSPFYGLDNLPERMPRIHGLLESIRQNEEAWLDIIEKTLGELFPGEDLFITLYPMIGYDMGIGLNGKVCMNCNYEAYLADPREILFYAIHECTHVLYERHHQIPPIREISSPYQWRAYFNLWMQNEGYAVYAPLRLRREMGCLAERDYRVLFDADQLGECLEAYWKTWKQLRRDAPLEQDAYLEYCFGSRRLTYRIGCELIKRIEVQYGMDVVQKAFYLNCDRFVEEYQWLLESQP